MVIPIRWVNKLRVVASRSPSDVLRKVNFRSKFVAVESLPIRVTVSSKLALKKPTWIYGGSPVWGVKLTTAPDDYVNEAVIQLPINRAAVLNPPPSLLQPYISIEIPYWISDANLLIQQVDPKSISKDRKNMPILNPTQNAADEPNIPDSANVGVMSEVFSTTEYFQLLALNENRKGYIVKNMSADKFLWVIPAETGDAIKSTIQLQPGGIYEDNTGLYTGIVRGFMQDNTAGQSILVNEFNRVVPA